MLSCVKRAESKYIYIHVSERLPKKYILVVNSGSSGQFNYYEVMGLSKGLDVSRCQTSRLYAISL